MFETFTDRARKMMALANQEALRLNHEYIGTGHILLGLVREGSGVGANVLKNLDVDTKKLRLEMEKLIKSGPDMVGMGRLPYTPGAKKVIEYAIEEARSLNHNYVDTEHILLGLLWETERIAAQMLMNLGLKLEDVRQEVFRLLVTSNEGGETLFRKVIEEAERDGWEVMNLRHWEIESLPAEIGNLSNLRELLLNDNKLRALPAEIGKLARLERLEVSGNKLTELPAELGRLANMQELYVSDNQLMRIPTELGKLKKLTRLGLSGNPLESPPAEVVEQGTKVVLKYLRDKGGEIEQQEEAEELGSYHAPIAAFSGDGVRDGEGRLVDQLGIEPEVNAMSSLVAACDIKWPLSIGLFGDWGSGKSFFMEMMRERIERISEESRKWVGAGKESAYCRNVVQIRFNAWHYMDANLWASLVTHIFDELAKEVSSREKADVEETRKVLFENLESAKKLKDEAEEHERKAADLRQSAESKLTKVEQERADAEKELKHITARDVVALAKDDPRIQEQCQQIADKLGLAGIGAEAENIRDVVTEANEVFGRVILICKRIAAQKNGKFKLIGLTMLFLVLPGLVGLVTFKVLPSGWMEQLGGMALGFVTLLGTLAKTLMPRLKQVSKGLAQWEKVQEQILNIGIETTRAEIELREEIKALKEQENRARQEVEDAEKGVQRAKEELDEIRTGRRLQRLIEEGSRKSEYLEKLGIIAVIRKDFEDLKNLVSESSEQVKSKEIPRIDRIILYVDDLDRCPSQRVVEVLQAVHLILGFELFVVVVAVDSRWILHALHEEYSAFGGVNKVTARLGSRWLTTPQNYVEKIFQIPFALRPMGDRGYRQLVGKLVDIEGRKDGETMGKEREVMAREGREEQELEREITQGEEKEIQTEELGDRVEGEKDRADEFEPTIEMKPPSANLSEQEAEFMKEMGDLIPSPRAAKRFVNIYRLTLANVDDRGKLAELRGTENRPGDYQAVLLMLAILTGFPGQGADVLKTLANGDRKFVGIMDFVSKLKTRKEPKSEPTRYRNGVRKGILEAERAVWDRLSNILKERIEELGVRDSLEPFVRRAGWVARFSFQYKPVISEEEGGEEDG